MRFLKTAKPWHQLLCFAKQMLQIDRDRLRYVNKDKIVNLQWTKSATSIAKTCGFSKFVVGQSKTMGSSITMYPRSLYSLSTLYHPLYLHFNIYIFVYIFQLYILNTILLFNTLFFFFSHFIIYTHTHTFLLYTIEACFKDFVNFKFWHLGFVQNGFFLSGYVLISFKSTYFRVYL